MTTVETSVPALVGGIESLRDPGAVLRIPHLPESVDEVPTDDETMIINMGPQHPSTHGVLRVMMELRGETVLRCKPVIGYLHTGMEKTGEDLTYLQGPTNTTRMDYVSPMFNELVFSLATEKLLDLEIPDRATWIRMLMCELNRMSSHLLFLATNGLDMGAVSMMIYGWREREETLRLLEMQGETVLRCKPIIGYLHTGMEKTGEQLTYLQGGTNVTRMDYLSPFFNELAFSLATEELLGISDDVPERAVWIRMLLSELNRMSSHLLFLATNGMDLGAVSMMIYGWREREEILRFFQKVTGLRMNHNF
ncbi:MAG TPA: hypothetical protein VF244_10860, partial [Acidimicrobiales bacterium]